MLSPELEHELREKFSRVGRHIEIPDGLANRLLSQRTQRWNSRRLLVGVGACGISVVVAVVLSVVIVGNSAPPGTALQHQLRLRLVDDQVALVSNATLATKARVSAFSCSSASECIAVGSAITDSPAGFAATTTDAGASWDEQSLPAEVTGLAGLSCSGAQQCVAVGSAGGRAALLGTTDGGHTWSTLVPPSGVGKLTSVSCASDRCWAVGSGNDGAVLLRGGPEMPWALISVPNSVSALSSVGCTAGSATPTCMAVGSAGADPIVLASISGGPWAVSSVPPGATALASAACTNSTVPSCTTLVHVSNYWIEASRFLGVAGQAGEWRAPQLLGGASVPSGTLLGGVSECISIGGPSCTPSNTDLVNTVTTVISDLEGQANGPGALNESLTAGYIASQASFSQPSSRSSQPLSPVWYLGVSQNGLSASEVLTSTQRLP